MKRIVFVSYIFACLLLCSVNSAAEYNVINNDTIRYEAESASYKKPESVSDPAASGGAFIRIRDKGSISWDVNLDKDGWYNLDFCYRAFDGEKEEYIIRNGYKFAVGFKISKGWSILSVPTYLKKGINKIKLKKSWDNIDIDYLQIVPVTLLPELVPHKNIFYREYPRDIVLKINRFGNVIINATCEGKDIPFTIIDYPFYEDAVDLILPSASISKMVEGTHELKINFQNGIVLTLELKVLERGKHSPLTIVAPYVEHGKSVLLILPTGKTMLIDCGKKWVRDSLIIPFLRRNQISKIDYLFLTHYHEDHDSGDKGKKIIKIFNVDYFYDYQSFHTGDTLNIEGVKIKVLNCFENGDEENTRSLSLKISYNGFNYVDGADNYADNQENIMLKYPDDVKTDLFSANHHFHGSVNIDYLRTMDPSAVFIQSQEAIYARSTYMQDFLHGLVGYEKRQKNHNIEVLPALEVGTIVFRVNGKNEWDYETYFDYGHCVIPYLTR